MDHSPSWAAKSHSVSQEILWTLFAVYLMTPDNIVLNDLMRVNIALEKMCKEEVVAWFFKEFSCDSDYRTLKPLDVISQFAWKDWANNKNPQTGQLMSCQDLKWAHPEYMSGVLPPVPIFFVPAPPLVPILSQVKPVHTLPPYFTLILSSYLQLCFSFLQDFQLKLHIHFLFNRGILHVLLISPSLSY
jgi:hypothetical protein